jgi:hypothetical protein
MQGDGIVCGFTLFNPDEWEDRDDYGNEELDVLLQHYGTAAIVERDGVQHRSPAVVDPDVTRQEWSIFSPIFKEAIDSVKA